MFLIHIGHMKNLEIILIYLTNRSVVIKNGIDKIEKAPPYQKGQPIKIIHQNTPWRGLSILLGAMQLVKNPLVTLDVYSSTEVYGKQFYDQNDHEYKELYEQARKITKCKLYWLQT